MAWKKPAIAAALAAAICGPVQAREASDRGRATAEEWCVRCHIIEPDGPFKLYPPSFAAIAVYRSDEQIRARIASPPIHTNMPRLGDMLTPEGIDDLVAYIRSLEAE